jgi:hypothetical protein
LIPFFDRYTPTQIVYFFLCEFWQICLSRNCSISCTLLNLCAELFIVFTYDHFDVHRIIIDVTFLISLLVIYIFLLACLESYWLFEFSFYFIFSWWIMIMYAHEVQCKIMIYVPVRSIVLNHWTFKWLLTNVF